MTAPETQADLMKIAKEKGYNNAGGGVYNHDLFWQAMAPAGKEQPSAAPGGGLKGTMGGSAGNGEGLALVCRPTQPHCGGPQPAGHAACRGRRAAPSSS